MEICGLIFYILVCNKALKKGVSGTVIMLVLLVAGVIGKAIGLL